jgi:hypothetical protein
MVAGHENEINLGDAPHPFWADGLDPAEPGSRGQLFVLLAVDFAGQTSDTFCTVVKEIKFAHNHLLVNRNIGILEYRSDGVMGGAPRLHESNDSGIYIGLTFTKVS